MTQLWQNHSTKWGIARRLWRMTARLKNKSFMPPFGIDRPEQCVLGPDYWHADPNNYLYQYNSWGMRDQDFEQYYGHTVNLCVGDSFTINIGGPYEHSWPYLLSQRFGIPTLNISIDGMSSFQYIANVDKCREFFRVNKIFVLYNAYDDQDTQTAWDQRFFMHTSKNLDTKLSVLKKHYWIPDCVFQFVPPWVFQPEEISVLYRHFPDAHRYLSGYQHDWASLDYRLAMSSDVLHQKYRELAGPDWITYDHFVQLLIIDIKQCLARFTNTIDQKLIGDFCQHYMSQLLTRNRDGWHMSMKINQLLADYFFSHSGQ